MSIPNAANENVLLRVVPAGEEVSEALTAVWTEGDPWTSGYYKLISLGELMKLNTKQIILQCSIVLGYFLTYMFVLWGRSGSDLEMWFLTIITFGVHFILTILVYEGSLKKSCKSALIGVLLGGVVCYGVYLAINYYKTVTHINRVIIVNEKSINATHNILDRETKTT